MDQLLADHPELSGTLLEEILRTMETGEFMEPKSTMEEGEEESVIGEMNSFERALYTIRNNYADQANLLQRQLGAVKLQLVDAPENLERIEKDFEIAHRRHQVAESMLWDAIKERLYAPDPENVHSALSLKAGWKILRTFEECTCGLGLEIIEIIGGGPGFSIMGSRVGTRKRRGGFFDFLGLSSRD